MRSRSTADLADRCPACHQRHEVCPCAGLPRIETRTRIVVVRHALEALKTTNTARLASLVLPQLSIVSWGGRGDDARDALAAIPAEGALLLYPLGSELLLPKIVAPRHDSPDPDPDCAGLRGPPSAGRRAMSAGEAAPDCAPPPARPASEPARAEAAPPTLIVPDGNWNQAKHMVRRLLRARPISCLTLPDAVDRGRLHLRERPHSGHRSTLEAIAAALALLEGAEVEARLLAVYDDFVQRVASTSGRFRVRP